MGPLSTALLVLGLAVLPGFALACEAGADWQPMVPEKPGGVSASVGLDRAHVVIGQPFEVRLAFCSKAGEPVQRVEVDAIMPLHKHGMNYRPSVTRTGPQRYDAGNLVFHMPGDWRIRVLTHRADTVQAFWFDLVVK